MKDARAENPEFRIQKDRVTRLAATLSVLMGLIVSGSAHAESRSVSFEQAQRVALEQNQMLAAARSQVDAMRARKLQSWAGHLPSFQVTEGAYRTNDAVNAFGFKLKQEGFTQADFAIDALNTPDPVTNYQTKLALRQPLFNGGQAWYGRAQADAGVLAARADLERAQAEVRFHTAEAYWGLVLATEALDAVRQGLETAKAAEAAAEARYEAETAPLSDLLAARVRVAELRGEEVDAANRAAQAADGLSLVMGLPSGDSVVPADSLGEPQVPLSLDQALAQAPSRRPDLRAARARANAASKAVGRARSGYLPHVNAFAEVTLDSDELFARQGEGWMVGAVATWDLFSGLKTIGEVRAARAQSAAAASQASFKESEAEREVRQAFRDVEAATAQLEISEEALAQSVERLRITQLRYREGLATSTELLGAEAELTAARVRRVKALHDLNVGVARVRLAAGVSGE